MTTTRKAARRQTRWTVKLAQERQRATGLTATARVATMTGEFAAGDLKVGDRVFTRDNGAQPIRRIERRAATGPRALVCIAAGALGRGLPEHTMIVAAQHRLLICSERANLLLDDAEVLVAAGDMVGQPGFDPGEDTNVEVLSIILDFHEVMLCDGCWCESADPRHVVHGHGAPARRVLRRFEAQLVAGG